MKLVLVVVVVVILVVGVLGTLLGLAVASGAQTEYDFFCPGGQMPPAFCAALLNTASTYRSVALVAGVIAIAGLVMLIAGAVAKGPLVPATPMYAPMPPPPPSPVAGGAHLCPRCGRSNLATDRFCMNCGTPL